MQISARDLKLLTRGMLEDKVRSLNHANEYLAQHFGMRIVTRQLRCENVSSSFYKRNIEDDETWKDGDFREK